MSRGTVLAKMGDGDVGDLSAWTAVPRLVAFVEEVEEAEGRLDEKRSQCAASLAVHDEE